MQHIQQMQRGAFFWVNIDMKKVYRRGSGLAMVLETRVLVTCDWRDAEVPRRG
jgi:hypothetical protein